MTEDTGNPEFIKWFRSSSPYINAHRGRTFVVALDGELLRSAGRVSTIQDLALLASLGVRLVLVHGAGPQIAERLTERGLEMPEVAGRPVTDGRALACVKEAVGAARIELEALFSTGLPNTPMAGADLRVLSGNLVLARPVGVRGGVDYLHTGEVRRVETDAIREHLAGRAVVLLSPVGYSPTGEAFQLDPEELATATAMELHADKLILQSPEGALCDPDGGRIGEVTPSRAETLAHSEWSTARQQAQLQAGARACRAGVARSHLVGRDDDGVLLQELYTRDGVGTLITAEHYDALRTATVEDVAGVLQIIAPLEAEGVLVQRSREQLELEIGNFTVMERDGMIVGCAALYELPAQGMGEVACVAVHPDYRNAHRGETLLRSVERLARERGLSSLAVLTTRTGDWFREQGFEPARVEDLPVARRDLYNVQRNSKVFIKEIS